MKKITKLNVTELDSGKEYMCYVGDSDNEPTQQILDEVVDALRQHGIKNVKGVFPHYIKFHELTSEEKDLIKEQLK